MINILVVEDEKPIANLIKMSLTKAGYSCTCIYDGLAAADILEETPLIWFCSTSCFRVHPAMMFLNISNH